RRSVLRSHGPDALHGQGLSFAFQELGNPKIQQLRLPIGPYQDVGRLEVAMHDQVGVGVGDRFQNVKKQPQAGTDVKLLQITIAIDVIAFDVLKHQIGLAGTRYTGVDQVGDIGMRHPAEDLAFPPETLLPTLAHESNVEEFDGHATI